MSNQPHSGFRPSMTWLHSWAGVIICTLLFIVCWTGTLLVFDKEIDRWMRPETRIAATQLSYSPDAILAQIKATAPDRPIAELSLGQTGQRAPFITASVSFTDGGSASSNLHPATLAQLHDSKTQAGTFLYMLHRNLLLPGVYGWWLVMFAAVAMLLLLITGVIIHRKIFADFFTFRPEKQLRRSSLDLHNITGVLFLPFHFLIAFSGLMIFSGWYTSIPWTELQGETSKTAALITTADKYGDYARDSAGVTARSLALDPLVKRAEAIWTVRHGAPAIADYVSAYHLDDAGGYLKVSRYFPENRIALNQDAIFFDLTTGKILADFTPSAVRKPQQWLAGFHFVQYSHWPLRWLYFIGGLAACILIGSGYTFWVASRRKQAAITQPANVRMIELISIASITGLIAATGAFLIANRLLPNAATIAGADRAQLEIWAFFAAWFIALIHAALRPGQAAWREQCWAIAALACAAVLLNWISTGDHPGAMLAAGIWSVAGVDLMLICTSAIAASCAIRLGRKQQQQPDQQSGSAHLAQLEPAE
jgi:uncharacterized iron-regulated membrane protein